MTIQSQQKRVRSGIAVETLYRFTPQSAVTHIDQSESFPACFEPISRLAEDSFVSLWHAQCKKTGVQVAIKILKHDNQECLAARSLLLRETHISQSVDSPLFLNILDANVDRLEASPWIAWEWVNATTLQEICSLQSTVPASQALRICRQITSALSRLREIEYTHGCIRPENILLTSTGTIKLINLGYARKLDGNEMSDLIFGDHPCSPADSFRAPELQSADTLPDISQDVYSLGVLLFRMLTGLYPFEERASSERDFKTYSPMLKYYCPDSSFELNHLVNRMLATQPIRRPHNLESLLRELLSLEINSVSIQIA